MSPTRRLAWRRLACVGGAVALVCAACSGNPKPVRVVPSASNTHMIDTQGRDIGTAAMLESSSGGLLVLKLSSISPGAHGLHLHASGFCDPPGFLSADAHYNPKNRKHGTKNPQGPHAGDLPNIVARPDSVVDTNLAIPREVLGHIGAGAAAKSLIVHAGPDDQMTDPSGNSGPRIACGVLQR